LVELDYLDVTTYEIQQKQSEDNIIPHRVPQGSILGLLLFLIYVNDTDTNISHDIGMKVTLFADDTSILMTGQVTQDLIFSLGTISGSVLPWLDKNRLTINKDKSLPLGFPHKSNKHIVFPDIILRDTQITYISGLKFLGVWLNHNFNWDCLMEKLIIKLNKLFFFCS